MNMGRVHYIAMNVLEQFVIALLLQGNKSPIAITREGTIYQSLILLIVRQLLKSKDGFMLKGCSLLGRQFSLYSWMG